MKTNGTAPRNVFANASAEAPQITVESITPEVAARMLGTMVGNRPLRTRNVQRYAREMVAGKWLLNGEAIKLSRAGRLLDGQHRLNAVLMAQVPVRMYVVRGVDEEAMATLDTGVGRNYHDVAVIRGDNHSKGVGPVALWWFKYVSGSPTVQNIPTIQEIDQTVRDHPSIVESAAFVHRLKIVRSRCTASVQGFVHAYTSEHYDREMADVFMQDLNDGAGLSKTDPIYVLRARLVDDDPRGRLDATHVLAFTIKAWNAWMNGEHMSRLLWRTNTTNAEPFPRFDADNTRAVTRYYKRKRGAKSESNGTGEN